MADLITRPSATFALGHGHGISMKIQCTILPWKHLHMMSTSFNTNSTYISSEGEPTARIRATHLVFHVGLALKRVHVSCRLLIRQTKSCRDSRCLAPINFSSWLWWFLSLSLCEIPVAVFPCVSIAQLEVSPLPWHEQCLWFLTYRLNWLFSSSQ